MEVGISPLSVCRTALERGRRFGVALEAYAEIGRTVTVKVFDGGVESVTVAEPRGLGVRAVSRGRVGYAFTADLGRDGVDRVLKQAVDNLAVVDVDPFVGLPGRGSWTYPVLEGLWRPGVGRTGIEQKAELALAAERAALEVDRVEAVEESVYADEESRVAIVSTTGIEAEAERSLCYVWVLAHAGSGPDRQSGLGFTTGREPAALEPEVAGREAGEKARALLGAKPCRTGTYTVVLDREVVAALLAYVAQALSAEAVQKGKSVFAGRVGHQLGSALVTLVDDGLAVGGLASAPFDGEGLPRGGTELLSAGVLKGYLHSYYTACKAGQTAPLVGNAGRASYRVPPRVAASNLVLAEGSGSLEDLVARVGEGLYVDSATGLHSGVNPVSGEISVGVTGCLISEGARGQAVREVTIATDFVSLLGGVSDAAADGRWTPLSGSVYAPSIAVTGVAVAGV
jgi:PmbA protein